MRLINSSYGTEWSGLGSFAYFLATFFVCFFGMRISLLIAASLLVAASGRYGLGLMF